MICELSFDARQRILLIRMGRAVTREALQFMQAALGRFAETHGRWPGILDLSATTDIVVPMTDLVSLAKRRPVMAGTRRVFVATNDVVYGLCRMVGTYQDAEAPEIVRSLAAAYAALGITDATFELFEAM